MLVDLDFFVEYLRCPVTGQKLCIRNERLINCNDKIGIHYEMVDGKPVLVDFNSSILEKNLLLARRVESPVKRLNYTQMGKFVKRLFEPCRKDSKACLSDLYEELLNLDRIPKVLIVGGGSVGFMMEPFYTDPRFHLVSFDIYSSTNVQIICDAHKIPFVDSFFDCVVIQNVLEHVLAPEKVVEEIYRVLNAEGLIYSETPFLQHVHEGPYDFKRYTDSGHRFLFRKFDLIGSGIIGGIGVNSLWTVEILVRGLFRSKLLGKAIKAMFFWLKYIDLIIPNEYNYDGASCTYFFGRKNVSEVAPTKIINYYRGAQ